MERCVFLLIWALLCVCASTVGCEFTNDANSYTESTVSSEKNRKSCELFSPSCDPKGLLKQWFQRSSVTEAAEKSLYKSLVLILAGNQPEHFSAVYNALTESGNPHTTEKIGNKHGVLRIIYTPDNDPLAQISEYLTKVSYKEKLPWSVILIENAQRLSTFLVNELLSTFSGKKFCSNTEHRFNFECDKLLLILSTNFGIDEVIQIDSPMPDQNSNALKVEEAVYRDLRQKWSSGIVYRSYRKLVKIIRSDASDRKLLKLVEYQTAKRKLKLESMEGRRGRKSVSKIDPDFLERAGFIGQKNVIDSVKRGLEAVKSGLKMGNGPLIFLFAGLPGTGKTFLGQLIAQAYNGGDSADMNDLERSNKYLHVDMGNYQDERAIDGFVDPSPGLEGEGVLSSAMAKEARIVVLLDEIEKAHPSLLKDMLLPVLDSNSGHVQQKKSGKRFPTRDAIFVLTTNCFDDVIAELFKKGVKYSDIVKHVGELFSSSTANCASSHPNAKNPFAWGPLWRRIKAGQQMATEDPFLAFLPPSKDDIDNLVEFALESLDKKYQESTASRNQGRICIQGLFYTKLVLAHLQRQVRIGYGATNMAIVYSFVERYVANLIMEWSRNRDKGAVDDDDNDTDATENCRFACLYMGPYRDVKLEMIEEKEMIRKPSGNSGANRDNPDANVKVPLQRDMEAEKERYNLDASDENKPAKVNSKAQKKLALAQKKEEKKVESVEVEAEKNFIGDFNISEIFSASQSFEISPEALFQFAVTSLLLLVPMYFFVLPVLKAIATVVVVLITVLAFYDPELALRVLKFIVHAVIFFAKLIARGGFGTFLLAIILCMIFPPTKWSLLFSKESTKASTQDILRRWKLLYFKGRERCKRRRLISSLKHHVIMQKREHCDDEHAREIISIRLRHRSLSI